MSSDVLTAIIGAVAGMGGAAVTYFFTQRGKNQDRKTGEFDRQRAAYESISSAVQRCRVEGLDRLRATSDTEKYLAAERFALAKKDYRDAYAHLRLYAGEGPLPLMAALDAGIEELFQSIGALDDAGNATRPAEVIAWIRGPLDELIDKGIGALRQDTRLPGAEAERLPAPRRRGLVP